MIFQPVLHPLLLALLFAPLAVVVVMLLVRPAPGPSTSTGMHRLLWSLRLVLVLACVAMLLRPGIPGGSSQTLATDTDVVIVVDTTASIVAEDWDGDRPRLDGVRADVQAIVDEYPGARFALITFDADAELRLPLTTDTTALISSMEVLRPEVTSQSRGSSIGIANRMLADTLQKAAERAPDRSRMVFYLGDGEQTASSDPESFRTSAKYADSGMVFGYGTADGGPMRLTTGSVSDDAGDYIEYQGAPALSTVDEASLQTIASELGVEYRLRTADEKPPLPAAPSTTTSYDRSGTTGDVIELYWIAALLMAAILGFELTRATMQIARLRGLRAPVRTEDRGPSAEPVRVSSAPGRSTGSGTQAASPSTGSGARVAGPSTGSGTDPTRGGAS